MTIRAFALAVTLPLGIVALMDRYPAQVNDAAAVVRAVLAML